ncbi:MAG: PHP domain-containing protein [Oscillospiraceae bacterium]|nr:PHP domain-containing protein [Oscillospiraceae bacterium]
MSELELEYARGLDAATPQARLDALRELARLYRTGKTAGGMAGGTAGGMKPPVRSDNVNNHIHTIYSFSPYSPAKAVYLAWSSGLATAGVMDHDTVAGAEEFLEAGRLIGLPVTVGFECRCDVSGTPFAGRRLNNPDQPSVAYMAMHGIPRRMLGEAERFLAPYRAHRMDRNRRMTQKLNDALARYGLALDYDRDVLPCSQHDSGGVVTERHILYALAASITDREPLRHFLLGMFKSQLVSSFYIDADEELPHITAFIDLAQTLGAVSAYAYLGDVGVSVTGDKKPQTFEDAFVDDLFAWLAEAGVRAVTYMPTRNSMAQLQRVMSLCEAHGLFQIAGEDINSPFQSFLCEKLETPAYRHLIDSAWALIGHERMAEADPTKGMFSAEMEKTLPILRDRVSYFTAIGKNGAPSPPSSCA